MFLPGGGLYLPVFIEKIKLFRKPAASAVGDVLDSCVKRRCLNEKSKSDSSSVIIDLQVFHYPVLKSFFNAF
jgi:hypothetical protein